LVELVTLKRLQIDHQIQYESATTIIEASTKTPREIRGSKFPRGQDNAVQIPNTLPTGISNKKKVVVLFNTFKIDPHSLKGSHKGKTVSSVVSFSFQNPETGEEIPVSHSHEGFLITLKASKMLEVLWSLGFDDNTMSCQYWNESLEEWKSDGCELESFSKSKNEINCRCYHLTTFSLRTTLDFAEIWTHDSEGAIARFWSKMWNLEATPLLAIFLAIFFLFGTLGVVLDQRDRKITKIIIPLDDTIENERAR